jgi:hydrogenase expression/formation protein HypE
VPEQIGVHGDERVVVAHGGGGEVMHRLIRDRLLPTLDNQILAQLADSAILPEQKGRLAFTTDSYVVSPLEFPGGDIGRLAVAGTVNDLAVIGARPLAISLALILEEGLPLDLLDRITRSVAQTAHEAGVQVVTGDTKVIERRGPLETLGSPDGPLRDGLFINTAGVGVVPDGLRLGVERIKPGDQVLLNGPIAEHGLAILSLRNGIEFDTPLRTDAAPLNGLISRMLESGADVKFMRDATRGGVAGVLADICESSNASVEVDEARVPLSATARHAAETLGLDPLEIANEGKVVIVVAPADAEALLAEIRRHPLGRRADVIGRVTDARPALVELRTRIGGNRIVQRPHGEQLPRIC